MHYRIEIDGLRAVAVLPVILFHAGFASFAGGFVGVDVFFVISGYLITSLLQTEMDAGRFSFRRFYERRVRRLAPALILVMLACLPAAWLLMSPKQLEDFAQSVVAVSVFSSNVLFWIESGYFAPSAELKPLLHTWSLAVEEQFYLFFPMLLWLLYRFARRWIEVALTVGFLASFAIMLYLLQANPTGNFFLSPSRFWELLTGAICARILLVRQYAPASALADGLAGLGLGLILAAVFAFDARTPFPSVYALAPVLGTALIILFAEQGRLVKGFLSVRVLVWIGLISYSAYLWHQPLFAFARLASQEPPTAVTYLVLAVLSIALAHLTWRCVERPFRRPPSAGTRPSPRLWTGYVMLSATLICLGLAGNFTAGFPGRMSPEQLQILTWLNYGDRNRDQDPCLINSTTARGKPPAACVPDGSDVLLIGDSHAHALAAGWPSGSDLASVTASACPPIPGFRDESRPGCEATIRFTYEAIARVKPRMIILHAHWSHYMTPQLFEAFGAALTRIGAESPDSRIVVLGSIPKWYPSLPETLVQSGNSLKADLFLPLNFTNLVRLDNDLARIASRHDNTVFISLIDGLCSAGRCRATLPNRAIPLIWDDAHLTVEGAEFVHDNILLPALSLPMAIAD